MGQFAIPAGASFATAAPQERPGRSAGDPAQSAASAVIVADSETRRMLAILRAALDRLPE